MVISSVRNMACAALMALATAASAQPSGSNPWGDPSTRTSPTPAPVPEPVPVPAPTPLPGPATAPSSMPAPVPATTTTTAARETDPAESSVDIDTGLERELPWFLPPKAQEKIDHHRPFTFSAYLAHNSADGDLTLEAIDFGIIGQLAPWVSVGAVIQDVNATVGGTWMDMPLPPLEFAGTLYGARLDIGRYMGRQILHQDGVRMFVLTPSATALLATNAWNDESFTTFSAQFRLVGLRLQICPGIHVDLNAPVFSGWLGGASRKVSLDPFADTLDYFGSGSGWGFELEAGFTWWKEPT